MEGGQIGGMTEAGSSLPSHNELIAKLGPDNAPSSLIGTDTSLCFIFFTVPLARWVLSEAVNKPSPLIHLHKHYIFLAPDTSRPDSITI
jgi:hypothetical protein